MTLPTLSAALGTPSTPPMPALADGPLPEALGPAVEGAMGGFAAALQEALADELARQPSLRVLGRGAAARLLAPPATLPQVARALRVGRLVTGSIARSGGRVRVTAELVDAGDERILWSGSAAAAGDPLELPAALGARLARELGRALAPGIGANGAVGAPRGNGW